MSVEILMPELGESVHEGTVSRWLKKVGDFVKEDEPVVEIMTDKVNTELGAPASGVLTQILIPEGGNVTVFGAVGIIEEGATASAPASAPSEPPTAQPPVATPEPVVAPMAPVTALQPASDERRFFTPVVRSIARENGVTDAELETIPGSGTGGRVTKKDVETYLLMRRQPKVEVKPTVPTAKSPTVVSVGPDQEIVPLLGLRKMIAEAMMRSAAVPTVSTVTQVDVTNMVRFREKNKETFLETYGVKLTYTPFFIKALSEALQEFPLVNSSLQADNTIIKNRAVHMGIAVALGSKGDEGLIVPVIKDAHKKSLIELAKDLESIAKKARSNQLSIQDVQGGTFTLTNPGTYGALFGTPMINAPQGGILGTYAIQKVPVIVDDMIAIRSVMHLVLTYDHRLIDGLLAGKFLAGVRDRLEKFDFFK